MGNSHDSWEEALLSEHPTYADQRHVKTLFALTFSILK